MTGSTVPEHHVSIETMTEADLDQILYLERSSFLTPWSKNSFLKALRDPKGINLVCRLKHELIGYMTSFMVLDEVYLTNLLIASPYRRKGYGTELLIIFMNRVRERKGRHIFLEVRENNFAAINFYGRLKFQRVGVRKRYYADTQEDALVMKKSLED